jgi:hypothetical protein
LKGLLTHSLQGLTKERVSMFLDVATMLRGENEETVKAMWTAWHGPAATIFYAELVRRSLMGTDEDGDLVMHDVTATLGKRIILDKMPGLEEHFGTRIWMDNGRLLGC